MTQTYTHMHAAPRYLRSPFVCIPRNNTQTSLYLDPSLCCPSLSRGRASCFAPTPHTTDVPTHPRLPASWSDA